MESLYDNNTAGNGNDWPGILPADPCFRGDA